MEMEGIVYVFVMDDHDFLGDVYFLKEFGIVSSIFLLQFDPVYSIINSTLLTMLVFALSRKYKHNLISILLASIWGLSHVKRVLKLSSYFVPNLKE